MFSSAVRVVSGHVHWEPALARERVLARQA
jgi:hypothetical protein